MSILIIIGIVMFILALANWGQSQGYIERLMKFLRHESSFEETSGQGNVSGVSKAGGSGSIMINDSAFSLDKDYAYDDDLDYFGEF